MKRTFTSLAVAALVLFPVSYTWAEDTIDIAHAWKFALDPDSEGLTRGWQSAEFDDSAWAIVDAGKCWENQGYPDIDGYAWYRKLVFVPEDMRAAEIWLNLGCLNDCGIVYCNGKQVGAFGDEKNVSVKARPVAARLTGAIRWGADNLIAIRVFDWGATGGPQRLPCNLTTDPDALAVHTSLLFAPGFDGRPCVVGVDLSFLGSAEGTRARVSLAVAGDAPLVKEAVAAKDYEGSPVATAEFDVRPRPGDTLVATAQVVSEPAASDAGTVLRKKYTWPGPPKWPGKYHDLKVLNNFVTELLSIGRVDANERRCPFLNPRDGWVFLRVKSAAEPVAHIDNEGRAVIWRPNPETGAFEAMQHLSEGEHLLTLAKAQGAALDIRAVPELAFCYWPTSTALSSLPPRDDAFGERYVFTNVNTLITSGNMEEHVFNSWRSEGRQWIKGAHVPGLNDDTAPTADFVYADWKAASSVTRQGYAGIIVDEFLARPPAYYAAWTEGVERLYQTPEWKGAFYAWVTNTYVHEPGLEFMRRLYDLGGRFAWERYMLEQPTEDLALL